MSEETAVDKDKPGVAAVGGGGEVPTVAAVVHLLRRGDRAEMLRAAEQMNVFLEESNLSSAGDEGSSNSTLLNLMEMHKNNALQTLLSAFVRCTAWPEVELPVARAIAHLVAIEDECDWQLLQQSAREILAGMQVLVTHQKSSTLVSQQVMCAQSSSSRLLGEVSALSSEEGAASLEGGPQRLRDIVAKAVFKLCFVLSKQWSQSPPSVAALAVRPPSIGQIDVNSADATNISYRELRRNRGTQRAVTDVAQLLSMIANIISMLTAEDSAHTSPGMSGVIDETTVLCSSAILSLSKVKQGRQSFVTHGLLALVTRWLEESKFILAEAFNKETPSIPLPEDHLVHKLINNVCGILVAVVSASSAQIGEQDHNYSIGWADSQIIAMGIPQTIVKVLGSNIRFERSFDAILESTLILFDFKALNAFAETLLSLSSRSHNRPQLIEARVPTALCILVLSTLAAIYPDTIPIVISTAEALVAPDRAVSSRAQPAEPTSTGFIASHPHFKKSALHHISGIISQSLNALSYFLDDEFTITASGSGLNNPAVPPLVEMLCHRHMMTAFNFALGSLSARKEARLACLRVVSCLSEWSASIDALMESRFSDGLLRICSSDEDAALSTTSHSAAHPQSHHHSTAAGGGLKIPTLERESTGGSSIHSVSIRMGFDDDQEETISACYILANMCQSKLEYAEQLYRRDLLSIMLELTLSGNVELERQSMRCVCAMCQIVASQAYDGGIFVKVLASLAGALRSPNQLMQLEAVKGISHLAASNDKIKTAVVEGPLQTIVGILIDPNSDSSLRVEAEGVLKNLGFLNGVKDLELCQFDFSLLKDWFGIKSWVITQTYGAQLLSEWIAELFDGSSGMLDIFIPLLPKLESSSSGSKRASTKGGGLDNPPKITLQRSLTDGIKSLFTFSRSREGLGSLLVHAQEESEVDLKNSIVSSLLLKRSTSSTSVHSGGLLSPIQPAIGSSSGNLNTSTSSSSSPTLATSSPFQPNHIHTSTSSSGLNHSAPTSMRPVLSTISSGHVLESSPSQEKRSSVESGSTASGEKPKLGVLDLYCALFPSRIHREHIIGLATLGIPDARGVFCIPRIMDINTVLLPGRAYTTFAKIGRILERMTEDGAYSRWAITFNESSYLGDFYSTFLDHIRRCPQIASVHFSAAYPSHDARMGYLAGNLPSSVQFLSFSNSLSPESVETLCLLLLKNNASFRYESQDSMLQPLVEEIMVGLLGLSIMNQTLDSKCLTNILSLLVPHSTDESLHEFEKSAEGVIPPLQTSLYRQPSMSYCRGLRYLDLSHNRLSDTTCAEIVRVACASALEYLDLGYNLIQKGSATRDALEKHLNSSRLRHLGLAHNELSKKLLSSLLDTLRSNSTLTSLDLSNNELRHSQKEYLNGSLRLFLRDNSHVRQMDLSFNNFDAKTIQAIQLGLLQNETMLIILLAGNVAGIKSNDFDLVLDKLRLNRKAYRDKASRTSFDLKLSLSSPPTMSDAPSTPLLKQEQMVLDSLFSDEESVPASLTVLFSAPLAWRDRTNKLYPIETLDHASERDALIQVFREVRRDISLGFDFATTDKLRTALSLGCRALHFSGHGHPGCLIFEDGQSGLQNVSVEALKNLLRAGGLSLDFVFVSACHSRNTGEAFADAGVPHVVCVKVDEKVLDSAAMAFTRAFYLSLLSGHSVRKSFDIAREALKSSPLVLDSAVEGEKFVLLPEKESHDVPLFMCKQVSRWPGLTHMMREFSCNNIDTSLLPSPPPDFEGREVDMYRVISTIKERRLVSVVGDAGIGKSALVAAASQYMIDRNMFPEGVLFVRLQGVTTHSQFLSAFRDALSRGPPRVAGKLSSMSSAASPREPDGGWSINDLEEALVMSLSKLDGRLLIVLDHCDELLTLSDAAADLKYFLQKFFERCNNSRILCCYRPTDVTVRRMDCTGVVEHSITLGSLTLISTLRLFARLAPCLPSAETKQSFVNSLLPPKQAYSTYTSKDLTPVASQIFRLFGQGHPATVVKMACEANMDSVTVLQMKGRDFLAGKKPRRSIIASRSTSKDNDERTSEAEDAVYVRSGSININS